MNKQKKLLSVILSIVFAVGMLFGGGVLSAFADNTIDGPEELTSFYVPAKIAYMDKFGGLGFDASNTKIVVTAPNTDKTEFDGKDNATGAFVGLEADYTFDQIGIYQFDYLSVADKVLYSKTAYCSVEGEYELRVAFGGADIPTYTKVGEKFEVPAATLYYKTEDMDTFEPLTEGTDYTLSVTSTARVENTTVVSDLTVGEEYKYDYEGSYSVVYNARLNGGAKNYTKTFGVKVQGGSFHDEGNPRMTVTGVPATGSVNTKVSLPKASATDEYDENVKVNVSVKLAGAKVTESVIDKKTGFAVGAKKTAQDEEIIIEFDNVYTMDFYPRQPGRYEVVYQAVDDFKRTSAENTFTILVEDRSAPTLAEIDEWQIPSRWGLNTITKTNQEWKVGDPESSKTMLLDDKTITFPYPEYTDNSGKDAISRVSFEIRDTVNNYTVLRFHNIYATGDSTDNIYEYKENTPSNGYYKPGTEGEKVEFMNTPNGFQFDFSKYITNLQSKESLKDGLGRYTAQYQARDKDQNITTKTYDITLEDSYQDTLTPDINVTFEEYLYIASDTKFYTVPTATVTDAGTTRTHVEYTIETLDETVTPMTTVETLNVTSGERLRIVRDGGDILLANADYIYAKENFDRTDDATEKQAFATEMDELSIKISGKTKLCFTVKAADSVQNSDEKMETIRLVLFEEVASTGMVLGIETDKIAYSKEFAADTNGYDKDIEYIVEVDGIENADLSKRIDIPGVNYDKYEFGAFAITGVENAYRDFVGFEMKLTDGAGRILDGISFETYYVSSARYTTTDQKGMIVVDNIIIGLAEAEKAYTLTIRAFDINGISVSKSFAITIEQGVTNVDETFDRSTPIGSEGSVNVSYTLKNKDSFALRSDYDAMRQYMVRKVSGVGNFSLMGSEFTAFSQGSCYFEEGYYVKPATIPQAAATVEKGVYNTVERAYSFDVNDTANTLFEIQGKMPTYSPKDTPINLPSVVAHNSYANAKVEVEVKRPNDVPLAKSAVTPITSGEFSNGYTFTPNEHGKYKVTYTASINNSTASSETFIITVGDNIAPTFTVSRVSTTLKLNDVFAFSKMEISESSDPNDIKTGVSDANKWDDIKFTKTLILPNGERHALPAEWGKTAADRQWTTENEEDGGYTLTISGDYKIEYIAEDRVGNQSKVIQEFTITGGGSGSRLALRVLSTVLIILAILLIAGVVLYFTRFQKKKIKA